VILAAPAGATARIAHGVVSVLLLVTLLRMAVACLTIPVFGYANNLDFFRQSSCVGVWEDFTGRPRISASLDRPRDALVFDGTRIPAFCENASDNLFPWLIARLHHKHGTGSVREVGGAKVLAAAAVMLILLLQPMGNAVRIGLAAALLLIFGDIAILGFFNTLYLDASAIMSATASAACVVVMTALRRAPSWGFCVFSAVVLLWLGTSKPQFLVLACVLGVCVALPVWLIWRLPVRAALLVAAGILGPVLFAAMNADPHGVVAGMSGGNKEDAIMATVLPVAPDKARALRVLGLPASCMAAIGETSFTAHRLGRNQCAEVDAISRARLLPLFVAEPATLLIPLWQAVTASQVTLEVLPHYERPADGARLRFRVLRWFSLSTWLGAVPRRLFGIAVAGVGLASLGCVPLWIVSLWRGWPCAGPAFCGMGGLVSGYAMASAVVGDGWVELSRHEALGLAGLVFSFVGGGMLLWSTGKKLGEMSHPPPNPPSRMKSGCRGGLA
jgi:hypothetical protein